MTGWRRGADQEKEPDGRGVAGDRKSGDDRAALRPGHANDIDDDELHEDDEADDREQNQWFRPVCAAGVALVAVLEAVGDPVAEEKEQGRQGSGADQGEPFVKWLAADHGERRCRQVVYQLDKKGRSVEPRTPFERLVVVAVAAIVGQGRRVLDPLEKLERPHHRFIGEAIADELSGLALDTLQGDLGLRYRPEIRLVGIDSVDLGFWDVDTDQHLEECYRLLRASDPIRIGARVRDVHGTKGTTGPVPELVDIAELVGVDRLTHLGHEGLDRRFRRRYVRWAQRVGAEACSRLCLAATCGQQHAQHDERTQA